MLFIISWGKNFTYFFFRDGTLRLWSCGKQKTLEPVIELSDNVNTVDITESNLNILSTDTNDMNEDEVGTLGKLIVTGGESGAVKLIDLRGRNILNHFKLHAAVNVVKFFDENHIIAGTEDGRISIIHVPDMTLGMHKYFYINDQQLLRGS